VAELVVVGGGVAGLATALAAARNGAHTVTVLERDATPLPPAADDAFGSWRRPGAPQLRHSHAFLARLRNLLRDRAPDVLAALHDAGATELPFATASSGGPDGSGGGDDDLVGLACRRTTFEWVLRRIALDQQDVRFRDGSPVRRLRADGGRVVGVVLEGGESVDADLVVDCSGRRSPLPRWLDEAGLAPCEERMSGCGIHYYSRFYRLRGGRPRPAQAGILGLDLGYVKLAAFPGDGETFSLTFGVPSADVELRSIVRPERFEAAGRRMPGLAPWLIPGLAEPLTGVEVMAGLINRRRRLVVDGRPVAPGLVAVGDAAVCTNPLYGRGCSLAVVHAYHLADVLASTGADAEATAVELDRVTRADIEPWYRAAVAQDRHAGTWSRPPAAAARGTPGAEPTAQRPADEQLGALLRDALLPAARQDPHVLRAFVRCFNLLDPPETLMRDPDLVQRVLAAWAERGRHPDPPPAGPDRDELVEVLRAA
jgi:2-polyprenyl-6-methoxyphenol hydroxylase-like FAD-dependent oxidoreductase